MRNEFFIPVSRKDGVIFVEDEASRFHKAELNKAREGLERNLERWRRERPKWDRPVWDGQTPGALRAKSTFESRAIYHEHKNGKSMRQISRERDLPYHRVRLMVRRERRLDK